MSIKGFIIAIEKYNGFLPDLPGVNKEAAAFRDWLINAKKVTETDIFACVDRTVLNWGTTGTTRNEIIRLLRDFKTLAANNTEELYFYFSGHGFSSPISSGQDNDVLVASDFDSLDNGNACISLDEIKTKLYRDLGPGDHFYFIDSCRNVIDAEFATTGLKIFPSELGTPSIYRLFSTSAGQVARTTSGFSVALLDGLQGRGIAKEWQQGRMWVVFDRLCEFIETRVNQQKLFHQIEGTGKGRILHVSPVPRIDCRIVVENVSAGDRFTLEVTTFQGLSVKKDEFTGPQYLLTGLFPGDYYISLSSGGKEFTPRDPEFAEPPFSLFDSADIYFTLPKDLILVLDDDPIVFDPADTRGNVNMSTPTLGGKGKKSHLTGDLGPAIKLYTPPEILAQLSGPRRAGETEPEFDPCLWLSLVGASRIVFEPRPDKKLSDLGLPSFGNMKENESAIFVLACFNGKARPLGVGINLPAVWQDARETKIENFYEAVLPVASGSHLLSLKRSDLTTFTYSVFCLPNRITLFVVHEDEEKKSSIIQFILPVRHLFGYLEDRVLEYMKFDQLKVIKAITLAQRQFSLKQQLADGNVYSEYELNTLIRYKWLDPVMSLLGAYELLRMGQSHANNRKHLEEMLDNLRRYFPGLPDTEAIARLTGRNWSLPAGPPLFLEGLLAFEADEEAQFAPPPNRLDYGSNWARWFECAD